MWPFTKRTEKKVKAIESKPQLDVPSPHYVGIPKKEEEKRREEGDGSSFGTSMVIAAVTDSAILGAIAGGSITGAIVGEMLAESGKNDTPATPQIDGDGEFGGGGSGGDWSASNDTTPCDSGSSYDSDSSDSDSTDSGSSYDSGSSDSGSYGGGSDS